MTMNSTSVKKMEHEIDLKTNAGELSYKSNNLVTIPIAFTHLTF